MAAIGYVKETLGNVIETLNTAIIFINMEQYRPVYVPS